MATSIFKFAAVFACLICNGQGRRYHLPAHGHHKAPASEPANTKGTSDSPLQRLSRTLLSMGPATAFNLARHPHQIHHRMSMNGPRMSEKTESNEHDLRKLRAERLALRAEIADLEATKLSLELANMTEEHTVTAESSASEVVPRVMALEHFFAFLEPVAEQEGIESWERLKACITKAWDSAQVAQRVEIETWRGVLEEASQQRVAKMNEDVLPIFNFSPDEEITINSLWDMASREGNLVFRRARARALTRATFKWFASQGARSNTEKTKDEVTGRTRLRVLEQHERAGCVEYRLFAAALADDDAFEESAGTNTDLDEESTAESVDSFLSHALELSSATIPQMFSDDEDPMAEMDVNMTLLKEQKWMTPLSELVGQSTSFEDLDNDDDEFPDVFEKWTLFPLFLTALGAQQGNFEPLVVYYFSRLLGRFNAQAIARYEGRSVTHITDTFLAEQEAKVLRHSKELEDKLKELSRWFMFGFVFTSAITIAVGFFVGSQIWNFFAPPPLDPLAF